MGTYKRVLLKLSGESLGGPAGKGIDENWLEEISLREAMKKLGDREKHIINLRFYKGRTQMEVAKELGISQAQVSRLEKSALGHMKKNM